MAGRPRSADLDATLTAATADLLAQAGYVATTIDAIAARAGVPKSTLYRRWSSKAELVFATIVHGVEITVPDTGSVDTDLLEMARRIVAALDNSGARLALPGLLADLLTDTRLMQRFHDDVIGRQRDLVRLVLDRAVRRGEIHPPVDVNGLHAQLMGTAYAWIVLVGEPPPEDLPERLATAAYAALTHRETECSTISCPATTSANGTAAVSTDRPTRRGGRSPR